MPFHDWLPDAMEGPTPASALIHAATMVAAGTYVIARLFPLYADTTTRPHAARRPRRRDDGLCRPARARADRPQADARLLDPEPDRDHALGAWPRRPPSSAPGAGISHLVGHAFFKALLFLGAGWLSVLAGATALAALRGRLRPTGALRWSMGHRPRRARRRAAAHRLLHQGHRHRRRARGRDGGGGFRAWLVVVALFVTVVLTAAYCTRAWLLLDTPVAATGGCPTLEPAVVAEEDVAVVTTADSADDAEVERVHAHGHAAITLPAALVVSVLAALTVVGTLFLTSLRGGVHVGLLSALLSVLLVAGAAYAVWSLSDRGRLDVADRIPRPRPGAGGARLRRRHGIRRLSAGRSPRSRVSSSPSTVTSSTPTRARPPSSRGPPAGRGAQPPRACPSAVAAQPARRRRRSSRSWG